MGVWTRILYSNERMLNCSLENIDVVLTQQCWVRLLTLELWVSLWKRKTGCLKRFLCLFVCMYALSLSTHMCVWCVCVSVHTLVCSPYLMCPSFKAQKKGTGWPLLPLSTSSFDMRSLPEISCLCPPQSCCSRQGKMSHLFVMWELGSKLQPPRLHSQHSLLLRHLSSPRKSVFKQIN